MRTSLPDKIIQVATDEDNLYALTDQGRLFQMSGFGIWIEIPQLLAQSEEEAALLREARYKS